MKIKQETTELIEAYEALCLARTTLRAQIRELEQQDDEFRRMEDKAEDSIDHALLEEYDDVVQKFGDAGVKNIDRLSVWADHEKKDGEWAIEECEDQCDLFYISYGKIGVSLFIDSDLSSREKIKQATDDLTKLGVPKELHHIVLDVI